jgi:hypothetical protein
MCVGFLAVELDARWRGQVVVMLGDVCKVGRGSFCPREGVFGGRPFL